MPGKHSRNQLNGKITTLARGVAIYKVYASPYWQARIWDTKAGRYTVRSTRETSKLEARKVADELAYKIRDPHRPAAREFSFKYYATRTIAKGLQLVERGERNPNYIRTIRLFLENDEWGLVRHFGHRDVRELRTRDYQIFLEGVSKRRADLSASTRNTLMAAFRNVLKVARDDGIIDALPDTPRTRQRDNPRPFFRFPPLDCSDEYAVLKRMALSLAEKGTVVRGTAITKELYDVILFCVHSFVRPTTSELYALKHSDVTVVTGAQPHLILRIRKGKTGARRVVTTSGAVPVYKRIQARHPEAAPEEFLFLPSYRNRVTASRIVQRQFNHLLEVTGLKYDEATGKDRSVYSLRHTAICLRLVKSGGKVSIYSLAKNAGTSVNQIERFYTKYLPLSGDMVANLLTFGADN